MPRAVEGKDVGETERRAVAIEQQQRGPQGAGIRVTNEDQADRIRGITPEPDSGIRPELECLTGQADRNERARRRRGDSGGVEPGRPWASRYPAGVAARGERGRGDCEQRELAGHSRPPKRMSEG